jgi:hypothetical protein
MAQPEAPFTASDLAEIRRRQRESQKLIARLAVTETLEHQERLAGELCPRFDDWIRGRNRIQATPARARRAVATTPRTRGREHRPAAARRSSSSSRTSSTDPGDADPAEPPAAPWRRFVVDDHYVVVAVVS